MLALIWVGTMIMYFMKTPGEAYNAIFELSALYYFYRRWSAPEAKHRQFHFILMCSYVFTTAFYVWQMAIQKILPGAIAMNDWWFHLWGNVTFAFELAWVSGYSLLFRRAKADVAEWRRDSNSWLQGYKAFRNRLSGKLSDDSEKSGGG